MQARWLLQRRDAVLSSEMPVSGAGTKKTGVGTERFADVTPTPSRGTPLLPAAPVGSFFAYQDMQARVRGSAGRNEQGKRSLPYTAAGVGHLNW